MNVINFGEAACERVRGYLDSYLSNELLIETNHEVLKHLEGCPRCAADLNARVQVRTRLKAAVQSAPVPAGLEARIQKTLRTKGSRTDTGWYTVAAAAILIVGFGVLNFRRITSDPVDAITQETTGQLASVMNVGLRDHLHCAVFRKYPRRPETDTQMAAHLGTEFAGLAPLVRAKLPADFQMVQGHRCRAGKRLYVHFIVSSGSKLLSLVLTRKEPGESLAGGIHQQGVDRYQVVGFEHLDYLVYVISDLDPQRNLQVAANLAPSVREYLGKRQG
ncbi:MAG: zf-HC2 domain-containing protein [Bryobacteraceae bacterium]